MKNMKKLLCILAAALLLGTGASADEGMWLLPLLQKMNAGAMKDLGCRLTPDQIYSINHSSLKDAIVQFGGGCTGEMISKEGLLVTNHHCGYSSIQSLSSDEHNYLEDGYWAMDRSQELPVPGLTVTFLVSMEDVTGIVEANEAQFRKAFADSADAGRLVAEAMARWEKTFEEEAVADTPACTARVQSFYNDNVYYLIKYKTYRDVRFVGAPPASIGKFGGETDNWMWPRHTGDFSMFRVYAGKDNLPADYSPENVPYEPAQALKVSLKGIQEGDFTMIMGYPGRTQRFQTVAQLEQMMAQHDISIDARTLRQDIMKKYMEASPSVRLKYADKYAGSSNGWKKWIGERKAFKDLDIIGREREKEEAFTKWVNKNGKRKARYGKALDDIAEGVERNAPNKLAVQLLAETVLNIELLDNANYFARQYQTALRTQPGDTAAALDAAFAAMEDIYADYYEPLDREETAALLEHYRSHADTSCFLQGLGGVVQALHVVHKAHLLQIVVEHILLGQPLFDFGRGHEADGLEPQDVEDVLLQILREPLAGGDLDHRRQHVVAQAVEEVGARLEHQRVLRLGVHQLARGGVGAAGLDGVVDGRRLHVVIQAALHAHQVAHGHHPLRRAHGIAVLHGHMGKGGQVVGHGVVQAQSAALDQLHGRACGEHLGGRVEVVGVVVAHALGQRSVAKARLVAVQLFMIPADHQVAAGHAHALQGVQVGSQLAEIHGMTSFSL